MSILDAIALRRFRTEDGRRLAFADSGGAGHPVLCLAGLTRNHRDFEPLAAHLAPRYRVIRLDSRGRGGSDRAEDAIAEYTIPVEMRDAIALVRHLNLTRVAIIGTSRGGLIGMAMAGGLPGLVSALVLNDVGAVIEGAGLYRIMAWLGRPPEAASFDEAARLLAAREAPRFAGIPAARWLAHARAIYDTDPRGRPVLAYDPKLAMAVAAAIEGQIDHIAVWPVFEATRDVPVLCIRGSNSDMLTAATVAEMARRHPAFAAIEIPDRGHAPFLDEPAALGAIDAFLEAHAR